jgi:hypothetical protein
VCVFVCVVCWLFMLWWLKNGGEEESEEIFELFQRRIIGCLDVFFRSFL